MKFNKFRALLNEAWYDDIDDTEAYGEPEPEDYEERDPKHVQQFGDYSLELVELNPDEEVIEFVINKNEIPVIFLTYNKVEKSGPNAFSVNTADKKRISYYQFYQDFKGIADFITQEFI